MKNKNNRGKNVESKNLVMSFIYSVAIDELRKTNEVNRISDIDLVYGVLRNMQMLGLKLLKKYYDKK